MKLALISLSQEGATLAFCLQEGLAGRGGLFASTGLIEIAGQTIRQHFGPDRRDIFPI